MGFFNTFLKQRKPKQFSYQPRYYDEAKENREKRIARIKQEVALENGANGDQYISNIKGSFRARREEVSKVRRRSNIRVIAILAVLIFILIQYIMD